MRRYQILILVTIILTMLSMCLGVQKLREDCLNGNCAVRTRDMNSIPLQYNVICPDGKSMCSGTCCKDTTGQWQCCSINQAVCCPDKMHCCPNGYTCDNSTHVCIK